MTLVPNGSFHQSANFFEGHLEGVLVVAQTHGTVGVAFVGDFNGHSASDLTVRGTKAAIERTTLLNWLSRVRRFDRRHIKPLEALKPIHVRGNQGFNLSMLRAFTGQIHCAVSSENITRQKPGAQRAQSRSAVILFFG
jgi:hypothetical protein